MNVVVYLRSRPSEASASAAALSAQLNAVASWSLEHAAVVIAEFTEAESGGKARPQLGKALTLCRREDARLLIARTNPIGSGEAFGSLYGNDISGVRCVRLIQPVGIVVYLRTQPSSGSESGSFLVRQREAVEAWLSKHSTVLIAEYIEIEEDECSDRPELRAALERCREEGNGTTLLVGTLASIGKGPGPAVQIPASTVPTEIAWTPPVERVPTPTPADIALQVKAPAEVAFFFEPTDDRNLSVYLCNASAEPLFGLRVSSIGETTHGPLNPDGSGSLASTSVSRKELGTVPPGVCRFVETYDRSWDGDFVTSYRFTVTTPDGVSRTLGAVIGIGGPDGPFMQLDPVQPESLSAAATS